MKYDGNKTGISSRSRLTAENIDGNKLDADVSCSNNTTANQKVVE